MKIPLRVTLDPVARGGPAFQAAWLLGIISDISEFRAQSDRLDLTAWQADCLVAVMTADLPVLRDGDTLHIAAGTITVTA